MQSHGMARGSRYNNGMMNAMLSEENLEEHFNSLLLDTNNVGINGKQNAFSDTTTDMNIQEQPRDSQNNFLAIAL